MDEGLRIPGTQRRIGLDPIVGLVPGIGDAAGAALATAILVEAVRRDITRFALVRMAANVALDALLGAVPVAGDLFDAAWKANRRNLALLERHIAAPVQAKKADRFFVLGVSVALLVLCIGMMIGGALLTLWMVKRLGRAITVACATCAALSCADPSDRPPAVLTARSVLPAATFRAGSPTSGAFLSAAERATASANGVSGPDSGAYLPAQPVQGFSSMVPADSGTWWALADNGYAWRDNSADVQLVIYRVDPRWGEVGGPRVLDAVVLRDPGRRIPWRILCDRDHGAPLPDFSFNVMPPSPTACGDEPSARILTGFDLDPESFVRATDGTFWIGEEFGPFLVHVAGDGRVLDPPIQVPGVRSPQNPFLDITDRARAERPTVAASRGFEGVAITPDGAMLYALLEGAVTGDDARDLRIYRFDIGRRTFADSVLRLRLEQPSQVVNLASLTDGSGVRVFPGATAPPAGPHAIGELKAVNAEQFLLIERDNHGDDLPAPRFKRIFLLDFSQGAGSDGHVGKTLLLDLLAIPDPSGVGAAGDPFRLPFYTIESVHVVDDGTVLVASDNNFPFSSGRARDRRPDRAGPLAADDTELILVRLGAPLDADPRLLPPGGHPHDDGNAP